ncbi:MAG: hypothetical protein DME04_13975 [Candidatus Rokuibacteriota bacterium]|nr:MAG: hypothetical protein DME04_13975 [Candidatus Rokubacteria bacterium]
MASEAGAIANGSLIGLRLKGRYRIVSEIGSGVGGRVCQAEDETIGHPIALRLLPKGLVEAPNGTQTIQRMSRSVIAVSAAHPALASVLAFGEIEQGWPFTVMEFVEGRRLSDVLAEDRPLDVAVAMRWALDLGGAVETLHNMGLVHGAVRPRNVVVLENGQAKLLDVELAGLRDLPALFSAPGREAAAEYLAPELVHRGPLTEKADVYAFAVVLYQMLTGVLPFQGATREAVRDRQMTRTPLAMRSRRRSVPAAVDAIVAKALDSQPDARPLMQDILNRLWSEANEPASSRRRRVAILGGGSVLAASVVGLVAWGFVTSRASAPQAPEPATRPAVVEPAAPTAPPVSAAPAPMPHAAPPRPAPMAAPVAAPAEPPPVPPPARTVPAEPPPAPTATGVERREPPRAERALPPAQRAPSPAQRPSSPAAPARTASPPSPPASAATPERPAPPRSPDPYDPNAVIDWLLNPSSTGRRE